MLGSFSIISVLAQAHVIAEHRKILTINMRRKRTPSATQSHNNHIGWIPPEKIKFLSQYFFYIFFILIIKQNPSDCKNLKIIVSPASQSSWICGASPGSKTNTLVAAMRIPSSVFKALGFTPSKLHTGDGQPPLQSPTSHWKKGYYLYITKKKLNFNRCQKISMALLYLEVYGLKVTKPLNLTFL